MGKRFVRARKPEEKEVRRKHLLEISRKLLEKDFDINNLSLNEIARKAGMAKANVYRYYETREALLLELLWDEWQTWYDSFKKSLNKTTKSKKSLDFTLKILAGSLSERRLLCSLTTVLPSILEKNLSESTLKQFKLKSLVFFGEIGNLLVEVCPTLSAEKYALLLQDAVTVITGLYPFAYPPPMVAAITDSPELKFYKRDFRKELERYLVALADRKN